MSSSYKKDYRKKIEEYNERKGTRMRAMEIRKVRIKNTGFTYIKSKADFEKACSMILGIYMYCARAAVKTQKDNPDFKGIWVGKFGVLTTGKKAMHRELVYKDRFYKFYKKKS